MPIRSGASDAGVVSGILAGLFGIGGGAIIVPVLFETFRLLGVPDAVRMQLCIGTSPAIIVPTAMRSYRQHKAEGAVLADELPGTAAMNGFGFAIGLGSALMGIASIVSAIG